MRLLQGVVTRLLQEVVVMRLLQVVVAMRLLQVVVVMRLLQEVVASRLLEAVMRPLLVVEVSLLLVAAMNQPLEVAPNLQVEIVLVEIQARVIRDQPLLRSVSLKMVEPILVLRATLTLLEETQRMLVN